jgi:hypothetical protein
MSEEPCYSGGKMRKKYYTAVVVLILLFTAGCSHYGALNEDFGKSYQAALYGQILNPGASKNLGPVTGLPGNAADGTMKKYTDSFAPKEGSSPKVSSTPASSTGSTGMGQDAYGKK